MKMIVRLLGVIMLIVAQIGGVVASNEKAAAPAEKFVPLFNGKDLQGWKMTGPGKFTVADGLLHTNGGMGLLWYEKKAFGDFVLQVEWKVLRPEDNSGIFLRFPEPPNDPWYAVNNGYEVQIQDMAEPKHRTGAIYSFQASTKVTSKSPGEWNLFEITVVGQKYTVVLNGEKVCEFTGSRSLKGYLGLQNHDDASRVSFRAVRVKELPSALREEK
ncbi:MAG: DUF1080 domain-containing protein [Acidobacteria bacterium]|nr:DUF1080 domain-containing protein [Acidobacteriota bacterium]MBI3656461.1 DUF1080 domain-containing protein [Acidobacteriota bacterium]